MSKNRDWSSQSRKVRKNNQSIILKPHLQYWKHLQSSKTIKSKLWELCPQGTRYIYTSIAFYVKKEFTSRKREKKPNLAASTTYLISPANYRSKKDPLKALGRIDFTKYALSTIIYLMLCLFVLRLNVPVNNFSVMSGRSHRFLGN